MVQSPEQADGQIPLVQKSHLRCYRLDICRAQISKQSQEKGAAVRVVYVRVVQQRRGYDSVAEVDDACDAGGPRVVQDVILREVSVYHGMRDPACHAVDNLLGQALTVTSRVAIQHGIARESLRLLTVYGGVALFQALFCSCER